MILAGLQIAILQLQPDDLDNLLEVSSRRVVTNSDKLSPSALSIPDNQLFIEKNSAQGSNFSPNLATENRRPDRNVAAQKEVQNLRKNGRPQSQSLPSRIRVHPPRSRSIFPINNLRSLHRPPQTRLNVDDHVLPRRGSRKQIRLGCTKP